MATRRERLPRKVARYRTMIDSALMPFYHVLDNDNELLQLEEELSDLDKARDELRGKIADRVNFLFKQFKTHIKMTARRPADRTGN